MEKIFYTLDEAAARLEISPAALDDLLRSKQLHLTRDGAQHFLRVEQVEQFRKTRCAPAPVSVATTTSTLMAGQKSAIEFIVRNVSGQTFHRVHVSWQFSDSANPSHPFSTLSELAPGQRAAVSVELRPSRPGPLSVYLCVRAPNTFETHQTLTWNVLPAPAPLPPTPRSPASVSKIPAPQAPAAPMSPITPAPPEEIFHTLICDLTPRGDRLALHWQFADGFAEPHECELKLAHWLPDTSLATAAPHDFSRRDLIGAAPVSDAALLMVGHDLFQSLFPEPVIHHWNYTLPQKKIRIVFRLPADAAHRLAAIPLESLHSARLHGVTDVLAAAPHISLARHIAPASRMPDAAPLRGPIRMLVFAANPTDFPVPHLEEELSAIRAFARASKNIRVDFVQPGHATFATLRQFRDHHIVHFIGHGDVRDGAARLLFESPSRTADLRSTADVVNALSNGDTRLLVLNGCKTAAIAAFARLFHSVVGMQFSVSGPAAHAFSAAFYKTLDATGHLDSAMTAGRHSIFDGPPNSRWEYRTPVLYLQTPNNGRLFITA